MSHKQRIRQSRIRQSRLSQRRWIGRGGMVLMPPNTKMLDILKNITNFQLFGGKSKGGYLFQAQLRQNYVALYGGLPASAFITKINQVLIKIIQIKQPNETINHFNKKEVIAEDIFHQEVITQNAIFQQSLNTYFEPICPNILISAVVTDAELQELEVSADFTEILNQNQAVRAAGQVGKIRYGFIVMELLSGCKSVKSYFPNYSAVQPNLPETLSNDQEIVLVNYLFQLIRLYNLNYLHGDSHLENALAIDNYDYLLNKRVFLIDFGRTRQISEGAAFVVDTLLPPNNEWFSYKLLRQFAQKQSNLSNFYYQCIPFREKAKEKFMQKLYRPENLATIRELYNAVVSIFPNENFVINHMLEYSKLFLFVNADNLSLKALLQDISFHTIQQVALNPIGNDCNDWGIRQPNYGWNEVNTMYQDEELHPRMFVNGEFQEHPETSEIYLWMIGHHNEDVYPKLFFIKISNCFEMGTKHAHLVKFFHIHAFYAAGELFVQQQNIQVNFSSGTYMLPLIKKYQTLGIDVHSLVPAVLQFFQYQLPNYVIQVIFSSNTFLTKNICCEMSQKDSMYKLAKKFPMHFQPKMQIGGNLMNIRSSAPRYSLKPEKIERMDWEKTEKTERQEAKVFEQGIYKTFLATDYYPNIHLNNVIFLKSLSMLTNYAEILKKLPHPKRQKSPNPSYKHP